MHQHQNGLQCETEKKKLDYPYNQWVSRFARWILLSDESKSSRAREMIVVWESFRRFKSVKEVGDRLTHHCILHSSKSPSVVAKKTLIHNSKHPSNRETIPRFWTLPRWLSTSSSLPRREYNRYSRLRNIILIVRAQLSCNTIISLLLRAYIVGVWKFGSQFS